MFRTNSPMDSMVKRIFEGRWEDSLIEDYKKCVTYIPLRTAAIDRPFWRSHVTFIFIICKSSRKYFKSRKIR